MAVTWACLRSRPTCWGSINDEACLAKERAEGKLCYLSSADSRNALPRRVSQRSNVDTFLQMLFYRRKRESTAQSPLRMNLVNMRVWLSHVTSSAPLPR